MHWLVLSILTAIIVAIRDITVKQMSATNNAYQIAALELFWSIPGFIIALCYIPIPILDNTFWWAFFLSFPLNWASYLLYIFAITIAPLSLTVPLLSFTPIFIVLTGSLILGEKINEYGIFGIILIVCSCYLLHIHKFKDGFLQPIKSIFKTRGSLLMLIVAFLFSFAAVIGKKGMQHSSPLFFGFLFFLICNTTILIGLKLCGKLKDFNIVHYRRKGFWLGTLFFFHILFHSLAIVEANAAYMIAIKRSSILISVFLGWLLFKEQRFTTRGPATLLMLAGAIIITIYG